jgi:hypothetical protein
LRIQRNSGFFFHFLFFLKKQFQHFFQENFKRGAFGWGGWRYVPVLGQTPLVRPVVSQVLPFFVPAAICSFVPFFVRVRSSSSSSSILLPLPLRAPNSPSSHRPTSEF